MSIEDDSHSGHPKNTKPPVIIKNVIDNIGIQMALNSDLKWVALSRSYPSHMSVRVI